MNITGIIYSGLESSQGPDGIYTTQIDNEIIVFKKQLGYLYVEARTASLEILLNNSDNKWYVPVGTSDEVQGMHIVKMQVLVPAGTQIFWKGYQSIY
jgi:hypothetical protein